jgi:hypothetical protein
MTATELSRSDVKFAADFCGLVPWAWLAAIVNINSGVLRNGERYTYSLNLIVAIPLACAAATAFWKARSTFESPLIFALFVLLLPVSLLVQAVCEISGFAGAAGWTQVSKLGMIVLMIVLFRRWARVLGSQESARIPATLERLFLFGIVPLLVLGGWQAALLPEGQHPGSGAYIAGISLSLFPTWQAAILVLLMIAIAIPAFCCCVVYPIHAFSRFKVLWGLQSRALLSKRK